VPVIVFARGCFSPRILEPFRKSQRCTVVFRPDGTGGGGALGGVMEASASRAHDEARSLSVTDSPCVAVCSTLYDDICRGCGRTAMEVANWVFLDEAEKREIWARITVQGYPRRKLKK